MHKNRPKGFVPPYEAYVSEFEIGVTEIANDYFGVQDRGDAVEAERAQAALSELLTLADAPDWVERGWCEEPAGSRTWIYATYWRNPEAFRRWWRNPAVQGWFHSHAAATGAVGRWVEIVFPQTKLLDTLLAHREKNFGIARLAKENVVTPYHGY